MKKLLKYMRPNYSRTQKIISNSPIDEKELSKAEKIIHNLQEKTEKQIECGYGPFLAAIYDEKGNLIVETPNSVINECNCINHAEINAIRQAQERLGTYDLSKYNLSIYITAEPCIMCTGAIMWSGIKRVFFGITSDDVEKITGFDEGYKPDWIKEFKKRNILVWGNIENIKGKTVLQKYIQMGKTVYTPDRIVT